MVQNLMSNVYFRILLVLVANGLIWIPNAIELDKISPIAFWVSWGFGLTLAFGMLVYHIQQGVNNETIRPS